MVLYLFTACVTFRFSGVVMGVSNTIGNIPGGVAPIVVAAITKDVSSSLLITL